MGNWPILGTQTPPTGWRLVFLLAVVAATAAASTALGLGLLGAIIAAVIVTPIADVAFRRLQDKGR